MHRNIEVIREYLSPAQVLEIRREAKSEGKQVNVTRCLNGLVEIEIITPADKSDVTEPKYLQHLAGEAVT